MLALANHTTGAPAAYWYVPANSPIKSFSDLNGKTVGYSTTGSSSYTALLQLAKLKGVTPKPVATGNPASTFTQAMSGQIDAGWSSPPFGLREAEQGKIRIIGHGSDVPALRTQTGATGDQAARTRLRKSSTRPSNLPVAEAEEPDAVCTRSAAVRVRATAKARSWTMPERSAVQPAAS